MAPSTTEVVGHGILLREAGGWPAKMESTDTGTTREHFEVDFETNLLCCLAESDQGLVQGFMPMMGGPAMFVMELGYTGFLIAQA